MNQEQLPATRTLHLTVYNQVSGPAPRSVPRPYTKADVLADNQVKDLLEQGYELQSFSNGPFPDDPYTLLVTVILTISKADL